MHGGSRGGYKVGFVAPTERGEIRGSSHGGLRRLIVPACQRRDSSVDERRGHQDERRHDDPGDKPRSEPLAYEHPSAEERQASNPGGHGTGETGLNETKNEIAIALRNQHCSPLPPITARL